MNGVNYAVALVNSVVWGPFMLTVMLLIGIYYCIRLRFFHILRPGIWWRATVGSVGKNRNSSADGKGSGISPLRAVTTALAGAIGTGNIVGVAGAVTLGGAGAVFWMWVAAILGMGTIYAENTLGVLFREKRNGKNAGGPMYYIEKGLGCRPLAVCFAAVCTAAAFGMGNMTQANSVSGALSAGFGADPRFSGAFTAALCAVVISGGIERISSLAEKLVPVMSFIYILAAMIVIIMNLRNIPWAFARIFSEAFGLRPALGGAAGWGISCAVRYGISRGVFSNEAGLGSSPIVHAATDTDDAQRQGMWGIFQVFADTIVMCTLMALCILTTESDRKSDDPVEICAAAFSGLPGGAGEYLLSVSVVFFAFATLVSWCYYGERSLEYLTGGRFLRIYRVIYVLAAYLGSVMSISLVWDISDTLNGLMAVPNLAALVLLRRSVPCDIKGKPLSRHKLDSGISVSNMSFFGKGSWG